MVDPTVILGASGFIGSAIAGELMREGMPVIGHSSKTLDLTCWEAFRVLDDQVGNTTTLVFASAITRDRREDLETFDSNVIMAINVARYILAHRVGRIVYIGSDSVYGYHDEPITEATPVAPSGPYAIAKLVGEQLMEYATAKAGIPLLTLRLTGVHGPGDTHGTYGPNAFARSLARDRTIHLFGDGEEQRDRTCIGDVARLAGTLIRSEASGSFNLVTGESRSFADVVETIRDLVPYPFTVTRVPRSGPILHRRFDTSKLRLAVPGFTFTPFKDGMRETLIAFGALNESPTR